MSGRSLRITKLNVHAWHGGAERCAHDIMRAMLERGHHVDMLVGHADDPRDLGERVRLMPRGRTERAAQKILHGAFGLTDAVLRTPHRLIERDERFARADIVHAHNLNGGYMNLRAIPALARRCPLIITLHDMWLLTGDCDHAESCTRWQRSCGTCPVCHLPRKQRGSVGGMDLTRLNLKIKRSVFARVPPDRLLIVTPSRWMAGLVARSHLGRLETVVVPNGVDLVRFAPIDRTAARNALSVAPTEMLLVAIAGHWDNPRKGTALLTQTIGAVRERGLGQVMVAGRMGPAAMEAFTRAGALVREGGHDSSTLRTMLSAADVALVTSRAENLPYTVSEALACGCPPMALDVGGVSEMYEDDAHGFLLPRHATVREVVMRLEAFAAEPPARRTTRRRAVRGHAERAFSLATMADAYERLYARMAARPIAAIAAAEPLR